MFYYAKRRSGPSVAFQGGLITHHMATDWPGWWAYCDSYGEPCDPPTLEEFRARFTEFKDYEDDIIQANIDDAACFADTSWSCNCNDCHRAILWLAAHFMALQAKAAAALPKEIDGTYIEGGQVTSVHFETMSVGFARPIPLRGRQAGPSTGFGYDSTPYGVRYLELLRLNNPAVVVV
jgi:hypothetical protein